MGLWRTVAVTVGLLFFLAVAVLAGALAGAATFVRPLLLLWLLVPMPLVFVLLIFRRPKRRAARLAGFTYLGVGAILAVALLGSGWYISDLLREAALVPDHAPSEPDLEVVAIGEGRVTLRVTPQAKADGPWTKDGIWGLEWDAGYDQVGAILEIGDQHVVREFVPLVGAPRTGEMVRLDSFAFPGDPQQAFGLLFEEVSFSSPLGHFPAWLVGGTGDTWVIFVHGRGATGREALRMLPTVAGLGLPSLIITYRNDRDVPASPDGFYRYGQAEWEELEGAAAYAVQQGAQSLILVGHSMGGAIVTSFLYRSPLAERVTGAVLDAPMLDFSATVDLGARNRSIPGFLTAVAKTVAGFRFDIDWGDLDYIRRADELDIPILLFQGDDDNMVPVETGDALAKARPDIVDYVRVAGATHVRSWNMDPAAYEAAVRDFLQGLVR